MKPGGTALVLGEDSRSGLAVVRSLGRKGVNVIFGVQTADSVVPHSRYVTRVIKLPSTHRESDGWVSAVRGIIEKHKVDVVIPCTDGVMIPLFRNRTLLKSRSKLAVPDELGFESTYFKDKTLALAQQLKVPIPASVLLRSRTDLSNLESEDLRFPVVLKPVSSKVWKDGTRFDMRVQLISDRATLARVGREMLQVQPLLLQDYFEGIGVGQEFLTRDGEIVLCFQHERVHEPIGGGGSSYRKSVAVCDQMLEHSKKLLSYLKWTGPAMVEFRQNRTTGEFVLMEINGRFWGSLPLAVAAGVDFPYELFKLMLDSESTGSTDYRLGLYGRNVQRDIRWFRERLQSSANSTSRTRLLVRELADGANNILRGRERWDEITLDDPLPGFFETLNDFAAIEKRLVGSAQSVLFKMLAISRIWPALQRTRIRGLLTVSPNLLFICRGNICRSPFAEAYASLQLEAVGLNVRTASAGTHPLENREPPKVVCSVSREFGVNLDEHRSRVIEADLIEWAGAVVCMDFQNYRELRTTFPQVRHKLFFLRPFDRRAADFRTRDPLGKPVEEFRIRFRQIALSVDGLVRALID